MQKTFCPLPPLRQAAACACRRRRSFRAEMDAAAALVARRRPKTHSSSSSSSFSLPRALSHSPNETLTLNAMPPRLSPICRRRRPPRALLRCPRAPPCRPELPSQRNRPGKPPIDGDIVVLPNTDAVLAIDAGAELPRPIPTSPELADKLYYLTVSIRSSWTSSSLSPRLGSPPHRLPCPPPPFFGRRRPLRRPFGLAPPPNGRSHRAASDAYPHDIARARIRRARAQIRELVLR